MDYIDKLTKAVKEAGSVLCVGLDPNPGLIPKALYPGSSSPADLADRFCREVIDATAELCCAYKPNLAFFEALGSEGLAVFESILKIVPPDKILIADAKRGDIGSTAEQYKNAYFDRYSVDALTLNPLMGFDTLDPFLHDPARAVYTLVLTSNPGAGDLLQHPFSENGTLSGYIAGRLNTMSETSSTHLGMVTGATHPSAMKEVLEAYPTASLLIPGIGAQGGSTEELMRVLSGHQGIPVISSSRAILYGDPDEKDWKKAVHLRAGKMKKATETISEQYV